MSEPAHFPPSATARRATDRLFFALHPDPAAAARIAALAQALRAQCGLRGRPVAAARLHVTLHYLGEHAGLPADLVAAACRAAERVAHAPFELAFDHVESFTRRPRNRPLVLRAAEGNAALADFRRALGAALAAEGLGRWIEPRYAPHVTLLYDDRALARLEVEPVRWQAREFALVRSLLGQSTHRVVKCWPLAA